MSSDEMCLEAKEVVQYTSDESSSDEEDFRDDGEDSDYGSRKGKTTRFDSVTNYLLDYASWCPSSRHQL